MTVDALEELTFRINGTAIPQGSKSLFRGRMVDANPKLKGWRATAAAAARDAVAGRDPFDDGVYVLVDFYLPRPRTVRRNRPTVKPDLDKLVRAIGDALTDANVWADDSLLVSLHAAKYYAGDDGPHVDIRVRRLA